MSVPIQIKCCSCEELKEKNAKLEAEAKALREQNTKFQHMLADVVAKHFAENIKRSTAQKSMDVYLSEGIRLLEEEVADARRNAEQHEIRANQYSEELAALRARVVVPEGYALVPIELTRDMWVAVNKEDDKAYAGACDHGAQFDWLWQAAIDAAPRLNSKAVSEGLLRNAKEAISEYAEGIKSVRRKIPEADQRLAELGQYIEELGALLGEGKEHE